MSKHPLPGHRWAQITKTFMDPEMQEQEGLLRNAAPDLLKACEAAVKYIGEPQIDHESFSVYMQLRAALKKARPE